MGCFPPGQMLGMKVLRWRKSRHSGGGNDNCVEVAPHCAVVAVRDSKHPDGNVLELGTQAFTSLTSGLKGC